MFECLNVVGDGYDHRSIATLGGAAGIVPEADAEIRKKHFVVLKSLKIAVCNRI